MGWPVLETVQREKGKTKQNKPERKNEAEKLDIKGKRLKNMNICAICGYVSNFFCLLPMYPRALIKRDLTQRTKIPFPVMYFTDKCLNHWKLP